MGVYKVNDELDERKEVEVEIDGELSKKAEIWSELMGFNFETGEVSEEINQYVNDHIAKRLEELRNEQNDTPDSFYK